MYVHQTKRYSRSFFPMPSYHFMGFVSYYDAHCDTQVTVTKNCIEWPVPTVSSYHLMALSMHLIMSSIVAPVLQAVYPWQRSVLTALPTVLRPHTSEYRPLLKSWLDLVFCSTEFIHVNINVNIVNIVKGVGQPRVMSNHGIDVSQRDHWLPLKTYLNGSWYFEIHLHMQESIQI